ncbi:MAG: diguanylate cyclase [Solirubrobacterales bacterium]
MSFRSRLTTFFVAIVLLPMIVVGVLVLQISEESGVGKTDARLATSLETGQALYQEAVPVSDEAAGRIANSDGVATDLADEDREALDRVARRAASGETVAAVAFYSADGEELARRGADNVLATTRAEVKVASTEEVVGEIEVSALIAAPFIRSLEGVVPVEVGLAVDGQIAAASFDLIAEQLPSAADGTETVSSSGGDLRAAAILLDPFTDARLAAFDVPEDGGFGTSGPAVLAALGAFLALALALILYIVRALQRQIQSMLRAARKVGDGDFSHRVPVEGEDEMAGLAKEFNRMSDRLEGQVDALRSQQRELERSVRRIGEAFASGLDREALLEVVAETAVSATAAVAGGVRLTVAGKTSSIATGLEGRDDLQQALERAAETAERKGGTATIELAGVHAIAHPLAGGAEDKPAAALAVARREAPFTDGDREVLRYLSGQAAASVENIGLHERVSAQAVTDGLTGLANNRRFEQWMETEQTRRGRFGGPLSLILLDLDNFKSVNDDYGHLQGDEVLRMVASVLGNVSREVDLAARYGGEEFVMALPRTPKKGAMEAAERVRTGIERATVSGIEGNRSIKVTASFGVATIPDDAEDTIGAIEAADRALYGAKRTGKNRSVDATEA